jgi:D-alanyl-D-alanine carboxypeptidase
MPRGRTIAHGYQHVQGKVHDLTDVDSSMAGAAGGHAMLTTAEDLSRFLHAALAGSVFRHGQTAKEMQTFVAAQSPEGLAGYGLGLERYVLPGGVEVLGHVGSSAGYRTFMFRLPAQHIDLTIAMNGLGDPSAVLFPALKLLLADGSAGRT